MIKENKRLPVPQSKGSAPFFCFQMKSLKNMNIVYSGRIQELFTVLEISKQMCLRGRPFYSLLGQ